MIYAYIRYPRYDNVILIIAQRSWVRIARNRITFFKATRDSKNYKLISKLIQF